MNALRTLTSVLRDAAAVVLLVVVWQVAVSVLSVPAFLLPAPTVIGRALLDNAGTIGGALRQTSIEAALGFLGGNILGLGLAVSFARSGTLQRVGLPFAIAIRSIPLIAITPLLTIIFGYGPATIVVMATLISFFPALVAGLSGLRAAAPDAFALMRVLDAPEWVLYRRLRVPAALPYVFRGVQDQRAGVRSRGDGRGVDRGE